MIDRTFDAAIARVIEQAWPGAAFRVTPLAYRMSHPICEVTVTTPDGIEVVVIAKHLGRDGLSDAGRLAKAPATYCARREAAVYAGLLHRLPYGIPRLVGYDCAPGDASCTLIIERVDGTPLSEVGAFEVWKAAARWLRTMHAEFNGLTHGREDTAVTELVSYSETHLVATGDAGLASARRSGLVRGVLRRLEAAHAAAVEALVDDRVTLVHGDFYPSNVLCVTDGAGEGAAGGGVRVVDWELAGAGSGWLDLAAFVAGGWDDAHRAALVAEYQAGDPAGPEQGRRMLDLASLHISLAWLGASPDWVPPREHAQDWLQHARDALIRIEAGDG